MEGNLYFMQISHTNRYNPEFGALHVANSEAIKIYRICDISDKKFLKKLAEEIKPGDMLTGLGKDERNRWHEMLRYAVDNAQSPDNITYLETLNNKPCGIITFRLGANSSNLDCVCTWPTEVGKKVKMAGKVLFYQLFKDFQQSKSKKLKLEAITNGPYNTIKKYEELGFKQTSNVYPTKVSMELNCQRMKESIKYIETLIKYKPVKPEKINLFEL